MTILATQKKRISNLKNDLLKLFFIFLPWPVSKIEFGKNAFISGCYSFGHPIVENGNRPDENQVSNTSSS